MPLVPFTFGTLVSRAAQPQSKKKTSLLDDDDPFSTFESLSGVQPEPLPAPHFPPATAIAPAFNAKPLTYLKDC